MEFSSQRLVDVFVAVPVGQIDHPNADALRLALAPTLDAAVLAKGSIVLDFSRVTYISSMGLRVLLLAAKELRAVNGKIGDCGAAAGRYGNLRDRPLQSRAGNISRRAQRPSSSIPHPRSRPTTRRPV